MVWRLPPSANGSHRKRDPAAKLVDSTDEAPLRLTGTNAASKTRFSSLQTASGLLNNGAGLVIPVRPMTVSARVGIEPRGLSARALPRRKTIRGRPSCVALPCPFVRERTGHFDRAAASKPARGYRLPHG